MASAGCFATAQAQSRLGLYQTEEFYTIAPHITSKWTHTAYAPPCTVTISDTQFTTIHLYPAQCPWPAPWRKA